MLPNRVAVRWTASRIRPHGKAVPHGVIPTPGCQGVDGKTAAALLDDTHVRSLETLITLGHFKLDIVAVLQRGIAAALDGAMVYEDVFAPVRRGDKTETLGRVKPLHGALHSYNLTPGGLTNRRG